MPKSGQQNRTVLFILCLLAGVMTLVYLPVTLADRKPIPGQTSVLADRSILSFQTTTSYEAPRYLVCSIDDDPEDYNNHGIYHPLELAVTVKNLQRLGTKHLFLGTHLHWPDLDTQDNGTLNTAISTLDSCIISIPLRRTASAIEIPSYLLTASVSAESIQGNIKLLPQVNNLSLAPTFIIPENTQAGFSQLETEPTTRRIPLLAQWGDRAILSSLLIERLHHLNIQPSELVIHLGNSIMLGNSGNIIPIDGFGYFSPSDYPAGIKPDIISSHITAIEESPVETPNTILTAAGLRADNFRAINQPVTQLNQLTLTPVLSNSSVYQPAHLFFQIMALLFVIFLLISTRSLAGIKKLLWIILLALFCLGLAAIVARKSPYYLATSHLIVAILTAYVYAIIPTKRWQNRTESNQGSIEFDDASNSFIKTKLASTEVKKASKARHRDRSKKHINQENQPNEHHGTNDHN